MDRENRAGWQLAATHTRATRQGLESGEENNATDNADNGGAGWRLEVSCFRASAGDAARMRLCRASRTRQRKREGAA